MNDMIDMSQFVEAKSDQLNADDLIGTTRTITVRRVTGNDGDQPVSIYYEGDNNKPFKPCKTMRRVLLAVWGKFAADYVGKSMTLYRDDKVTFGGLEVGGIRISHMSHLDADKIVVVNKTKGRKGGIKIQPLATATGQNTARQTAEQWADEHMAALGEIQTVEALEAYIARGSKPMGKLQQEKPELHVRVETAYAARRAELEQEGPATQQRGEAFTEDGGFADFGGEGE